MHALEKKALNDPFLADALEGTESISSEVLAQDITEINKKILNRKKSSLFSALRIAAGIVLLAVSVFLVYQFAPRHETIALKSKKPQKVESGNEVKSETLKIESEKYKDEGSKLKVENEKLREEGDKQAPATLGVQHRAAKIQPSPAPVQELATANEPAKLSAEEKEENKNISKAGESENQPAITSVQSADQVAPVQDLKAADKPSDSKKEAFAKSNAAMGAGFARKRQAPQVINGTVVSAEDGTPVSGANVVIKGTTTGSVTDTQGNFNMPGNAQNQSLVFSSIGYQSQEVNTSGQNLVNVQLKADAAQMSEVVVTKVDVQKDDNAEPVIKLAEPVGGKKAYDKYLEDNIRYPEAALKNKIKGKVVVELVVRPDGTLDQFKVIESLGYGCDEELIRLIKEGPKWNAGTEDGRTIENKIRVQLRFDAERTNK